MTLFVVLINLLPMIAFWSIAVIAPRGKFRIACLVWGTLYFVCFALIASSQWVFELNGCTGTFKYASCPPEFNFGYHLMSVNFVGILLMTLLAWISAILFLPALIQAIRIRRRTR